MDSLRILVMGEERIGKSSLIHTFISRRFNFNMCRVLTDAILPPEATTSGRAIVLVDSAGYLSENEKLERNIVRCDAILLCYDFSNPSTFDKLGLNWIPYIEERVGVTKVPILMVGLRYDVVSNSLLEEEEERRLERANQLISRHQGVVLHVTVSSKTRMNVELVFKKAQDLILFPIFPLLDPNDDLSRRCIWAARYVFRCCDLNGDGFLNGQEIGFLNSVAFDLPYDPQSVSVMKREICQRMKGSWNDDMGMTEVGFWTLLRMHIENLETSTIWAIFKSFGFDDDLKLDSGGLISQLRREPKASMSEGSKFFLSSLYTNLSNPSQNAIVAHLFWGVEEEGMVQEEKRLEEERDQNQNQDEEEDEIKLEEEEEEMNIWPWRNERISTELGETLDIGCGSDGSRIVTLEEFMSVWEGICRWNSVLFEEYLIKLGYGMRGESGVVCEGDKRERSFFSFNLSKPSSSKSTTISSPLILLITIQENHHQPISSSSSSSSACLLEGGSVVVSESLSGEEEEEEEEFGYWLKHINEVDGVIIQVMEGVSSTSPSFVTFSSLISIPSSTPRRFVVIQPTEKDEENQLEEEEEESSSTLYLISRLAQSQHVQPPIVMQTPLIVDHLPSLVSQLIDLTLKPSHTPPPPTTLQLIVSNPALIAIPSLIATGIAIGCYYFGIDKYFFLNLYSLFSKTSTEMILKLFQSFKTTKLLKD